MKNLHKIEPEITDRHWAAAEWLSGDTIEIRNGALYCYYDIFDSKETMRWDSRAWDIVLKQWKDKGSAKTEELRKHIKI